MFDFGKAARWRSGLLSTQNWPLSEQGLGDGHLSLQLRVLVRPQRALGRVGIYVMVSIQDFTRAPAAS